MSGFSKARNLGAILVVMAIGLWAAQGDSGGKPYLKVTGPPPLRFDFVAENDAGFLALLELPKQKESTITNMPPPKPESDKAETYTSGGTLSPVISASAYPYGMFGFGYPYGMPYGMPPYGGIPPMGTYGSSPIVPMMPAGAPGNSASNMLSVNPQMINDYFKPNPTEPAPAGPTPYQPGQAITVPQELGFVPPTSPQSQSTYTSK